MSKSKFPQHPGKILFEQAMTPLSVSRNKLARDIDVPVGRISDIVSGKRGVTPDTALRLAKYFGTTPELWMRLQWEYDLHVSRSSSWPKSEPRVRVYAPEAGAAKHALTEPKISDDEMAGLPVPMAATNKRSVSPPAPPVVSAPAEPANPPAPPVSTVHGEPAGPPAPPIEPNVPPAAPVEAVSEASFPQPAPPPAVAQGPTLPEPVAPPEAAYDATFSDPATPFAATDGMAHDVPQAPVGPAVETTPTASAPIGHPAAAPYHEMPPAPQEAAWGTAPPEASQPLDPPDSSLWEKTFETVEPIEANPMEPGIPAEMAPASPAIRQGFPDPIPPIATASSPYPAAPAPPVPAQAPLQQGPVQQAPHYAAPVPLPPDTVVPPPSEPGRVAVAPGSDEYRAPTMTPFPPLTPSAPDAPFRAAPIPEPHFSIESEEAADGESLDIPEPDEAPLLLDGDMEYDPK